MKTNYLLLSLLALFLVSCHSSKLDEILVLRKAAFNADWLFYLDDLEQANQCDFDDSAWENVKVPHDWSIHGEIDQANPSGSQGGFYPCGIGYYRKSFDFDQEWKGKRVLMTFDGIMSNSEVWINGQSLGKRPSGYVGFTYDLTPYLMPQKNVLAVRVDNSAQPASRWYTGSGIYRNVWLIVKNRVAIAENGTYVRADKVSPTSADLTIETRIVNDLSSNASITVHSEIYTPEGVKVGEQVAGGVVNADKDWVLKQELTLENPKLWDINNPVMYELVSKVFDDGELIDVYKTPFGIKDIKFEVETGFWLNGKNIKVKGVNNHHDAGPVGAAVPNDVLHRRLLILKEMGCNAIRTAHNPAAPEFYTMCDTMGFLVMDEVFDEWMASWPWENYQNQGKVAHGYHKYFEEWSQQDLRDVIIRDRNHPSIFMWSVGNEIPDQCYPEGPKRLKPLMDIVHALDDTRPVTCGCCFIHLANATGFASMLDVTGYNGGGGSVFYEKDKAVYPTRKFIATEVPHSFQTRGMYRTHTVMRAPDQGIEVPPLTEEEVFPELSEYYASSYDNASVRISARDSWRRTDSLAYMAGEFRWTGYDYLGESIKGWPARFWDFGIIDLCGFPKDHYYFYQSQWTSDPMVHILPHWTWPGKEGKIIPVWTYSNADEVELFFNGKSLGAKSNKLKMNLSWDVEYAAGELKAVARTKGQVVAEQIITTASAPAKIEMIADRTSINADGESCIHLECNVLDKAGNFVPNADNLITFNITGPGVNIGLDNGDCLDLSSTKINQRKTFNGKCLMIIQSTGVAGDIRVEALADGLESCIIEVKAL